MKTRRYFLFRSLCFVSPAILSVAGCRSGASIRKLPVLAVDSAPTMPIRLVSASSHSLRHLHIEFSDSRPDAERHYYPGLSEPVHWRDSVSMVPLESFDPPIEVQLREALNSDDRIDDSVSEIQIEWTSFQFAYDQREDSEGRFRAQLVNWNSKTATEDLERQERQRQSDDSIDDESVSDMIFGGVFRAALRAVFIDVPLAVMRSSTRQELTTAAPQQTPPIITDGKQPGLNCQIQAEVTLTTRSGQQARVTVDVAKNSPARPDLPLQPQIATLVEESLVEFCRQLGGPL